MESLASALIRLGIHWRYFVASFGRTSTGCVALARGVLDVMLPLACSSSGPVFPTCFGFDACFQALSYCGFVTVEYEKMQETFNEALEIFDYNKNGKLDAEDALTLYDKVFKVSTCLITLLCIPLALQHTSYSCGP